VNNLKLPKRERKERMLLGRLISNAFSFFEQNIYPATLSCNGPWIVSSKSPPRNSKAPIVFRNRTEAESKAFAYFVTRMTKTNPFGLPHQNDRKAIKNAIRLTTVIMAQAGLAHAQSTNLRQ